jgi:hypothetical protein
MHLEHRYNALVHLWQAQGSSINQLGFKASYAQNETDLSLEHKAPGNKAAQPMLFLAYTLNLVIEVILAFVI